jgi:hypothetical protein
MSCLSPNYFPIPQRVWSRNENACAYFTNNTGFVKDPLTGNAILLPDYDIQQKIQYKGNILQYKINSSNLTQNQKYSQICKNKWCNRTKCFATQSQTYTNPNTSSFLRISTGVTLIPYGNNPTYNFYNPFDCSINTLPPTNILDGGSLIGTTIVQPCNNTILYKTYQTNSALTTASDVPGVQKVLSYNPKQPTYYPRNKLIQSSSGNKFPTNYKFLVSANSRKPIHKFNNY